MMDVGPGRPAGVSIGRFLHFDRSALVNDDFTAVISAIDRVHGVDIGLPMIPLLNWTAPRGIERQSADAWFSFQIGLDGDIWPRLIAARPDIAHRRIKTLHVCPGLPGNGP